MSLMNPAELHDGKVARLTFDEVSPFMVFERPSVWKGSWLLPALLIAVASLLVTALAWPLGALTRQHYGLQQSTPPGQDALVHRCLRVAAVATVLMWLAWAATIGILMSDLSNLSPRADGWLWSLQGFSAITVLGGLIAGSLHAARVIRSQRPWYAKTWAVLLALALAVSAWVAAAYHVIAFRVSY